MKPTQQGRKAKHMRRRLGRWINRTSATILTGALSLMVGTLCLSAQQGGPPEDRGNGNGPPEGRGNHTETLGNNLSYPVIWADTALEVPGTMGEASLNTEWPEEVYVDGTWYHAYPQKTEGNVWQAQNEPWPSGASVDVDWIDWGDSLESIDMKVGRPVRIELTLYKDLPPPVTMTGFEMVMLANPSSPDEVQGAISLYPPPTSEAITYESTNATVYSEYGRLVVQQLLAEDLGDLRWDGAEWYDDNPDDGISVGAPEPLTFTGELNVAGKVIYGLSQGGWRPTAAGDYRLTFYFAAGGTVNFRNAQIVPLAPEAVIAAAEEGGGEKAKVDTDHNLTYIDIHVVAGGGGGKGGRP